MLDSNLAHRGRPKKRGRPSKADKLAIELARRVAGAVSAAAAAAKASATKAREQVLKRGRGRPPKQALKIDVLGGEPSSQEDEEEEAAPVVRPKSRRKGAPRRAPGSTTDWGQKPVLIPPIKRQPRDIKHLDLSATDIGKRETKRNPRFDEYVTFPRRKEESSAEDTSRNPQSSEAASDFDTDSNARGASRLRKEGPDVRWDGVVQYIDKAREEGLLSNDEAEQLKKLAQERDVFLEILNDAILGSQLDFANTAKEILRQLEAESIK